MTSCNGFTFELGRIAAGVLTWGVVAMICLLVVLIVTAKKK